MNNDETDYRMIFRQTRSLFLLLSVEKNIIDATDDYLSATLSQRDRITGKPLFTVFPDDPNQPEATGVKNLNNSLDYVLTNKVVHVMDLQKYNVPKNDGSFELRYWLPRNMPIFDDKGDIAYILHQAENVTDFVLLQQKNTSQTTKLDKAEVEIFLRSQELQRQARDLESVNRQLQISRDEAIEASRLKSALIANVSHELRTPLSGILGYIELLGLSTLTKEQVEKVDSINASAQTLLSMVNDLLNVSRIEAEQVALVEVPISIHSIVKILVDKMKSAADAKKLKLDCILEHNIPEQVLGDGDKLLQILNILTNNAIKFTHTGSVTVKVSAFPDERIRFHVIDTGIGIEEEVKEKLFTSFYQADVSDTRRYGGAGIGLYIAKGLVMAMKGQIGVDSVFGKGSDFWFEVPLKAILKSKSLEKKPIDQYRILVVDDNSVIQNLSSQQLHVLGYKHIQRAENGQEAVDMVKQSLKDDLYFDIILMDLQMPIMDGYTATSRIRRIVENTENRNLVIIAMTASVKQEEKNKALQTGMDDVLGKPFSLKDLRNMLNKYT